MSDRNPSPTNGSDGQSPTLSKPATASEAPAAAGHVRKRNHDDMISMPPPPPPSGSRKSLIPRAQGKASPTPEAREPDIESVSERKTDETSKDSAGKNEDSSHETTDKDADTNETEDEEGWADPKAPLPPMDWVDLETRFQDAMDDQDDVEREIYEEFTKCFQFFAHWLQVPSTAESEHATKRLKTRMYWVQNSEKELAKLQGQYRTVMKALEGALALV